MPCVACASVHQSRKIIYNFIAIHLRLVVDILYFISVWLILSNRVQLRLRANVAFYLAAKSAVQLALSVGWGEERKKNQADSHGHRSLLYCFFFCCFHNSPVNPNGNCAWAIRLCECQSSQIELASTGNLQLEIIQWIMHCNWWASSELSLYTCSLLYYYRSIEIGIYIYIYSEIVLSIILCNQINTHMDILCFNAFFICDLCST